MPAAERSSVNPNRTRTKSSSTQQRLHHLPQFVHPPLLFVCVYNRVDGCLRGSALAARALVQFCDGAGEWRPLSLHWEDQIDYGPH